MHGVVRGALAVAALLIASRGVAQAPGGIVGTVVDAESGAPVAAATVRLVELGRAELSHADGSFHFDRLPPGRYRVVAQRVGYAPTSATVVVEPGARAEVRIALPRTPLELEALVVTAAGRERPAEQAYRPTATLSEAELRRRLAGSLAATIATLPGVTQRYNTPVAAQPVIRGLSGDRVLVLEDGQRTGDLSTTSPDHAVAADPLTAERIEVVRGPAGLLYGSNALGGVVNVLREDVPRTRPEGLSGSASAQLESVNRGRAAALVARGALGEAWAWRAEGLLRGAGDVRTPQGPLPSTGADALQGALGVARVGARGFAGVALRGQRLDYGVPGGFRGQTAPGAHPNGADVAARRLTLRAEALRTAWGPWNAVHADAGLVVYDHQEYERDEDGDRHLGTHFRQYTYTAQVLARHGHERERGPREGSLGAAALVRSVYVGGESTGTRPSRTASGAVFGYEEFAFGPWQLQAGARLEGTRIVPLDRRPGLLGAVRPRTFLGLSGSLALLRSLGGGVSVGVNLARTVRSPSVEELYSNGPHLASYSYEIGNPNLAAEVGWGTDLFLRVQRAGLQGEATVFHNAIDGYIAYAPTGARDPRLGRYPVYQATQRDARLVGTEGRLQLALSPRWATEVRWSTVRGTERDGTARPLPAMPPDRGALELRYSAPTAFAGLTVEGIAAQRRTAEFEQPTPGTALLHAAVGLRWSAGGRLQSLTLQVQNLTNRLWWDHLSRLRAVAPQPGRNVQVLYRLSWGVD